VSLSAFRSGNYFRQNRPTWVVNPMLKISTLICLEYQRYNDHFKVHEV
jgi:hypothetical protein